MYNSFIQPIFDYCSVVWEGLGTELARKIQKLQNRAARIITFSNFDSSSDPLLEKLEWDRLSIRRTKLLATEMFKVYNNQAPEYLTGKFIRVQTPHNTRGSSTKLQLPLPKTNYGKKRFGHRGASIWNKLPEDLRNCKSLSSFKGKLSKLPPIFFDAL